MHRLLKTIGDSCSYRAIVLKVRRFWSPSCKTGVLLLIKLSELKYSKITYTITILNTCTIIIYMHYYNFFVIRIRYRPIKVKKIHLCPRAVFYRVLSARLATACPRTVRPSFPPDPLDPPAPRPTSCSACCCRKWALDPRLYTYKNFRIRFRWTLDNG